MLSIRGAICAIFMSLLLTTTRTDCPACPHTTAAAAGRRGFSAGGIRDIVARTSAALDPGWYLQRLSYGRSTELAPARDGRHAMRAGSACAAPRAMLGLKVSSLRCNKHLADGKVPRVAAAGATGGMAFGRGTRAAHGLPHR
jgi:hypothetical protein